MVTGPATGRRIAHEHHDTFPDSLHRDCAVHDCPGAVMSGLVGFLESWPGLVALLFLSGMVFAPKPETGEQKRERLLREYLRSDYDRSRDNDY